ncbi:MAG: hydroxymethylglutaryl-CoA lyase [Thiotrichales bacterium]|jgi:hydroxymethylglutaryl-CoA lyase|nr:hydroxymethylglutaryl-CoA lyase [Thiotrichales bacterium]
MSEIDIEVSEVGPRDGLQSISQIMPTESKKRWIKALALAGIPEIEVGSFVPAHIFPQLADTMEVAKFARTIEGLKVAALVPNLKGAENAILAGVNKLTIPLSVSETHSMRNVNRTHDQMLVEVKRIVELIRDLPIDERPLIEGALSTAFGCTIEGSISEDRVVELAEALMEAGCDEVGLSDTTGYANPVQVKRLIGKVWDAIGRDHLTGIHLHNTRGQGLANVLAALEVGLTTIDSSMGGIGGCPAAPGASGNIVTEDLVFLLEAMGLKTGIDFDKLISARNVVAKALPDVELYGFTPDAGLPLSSPSHIK